MKKYLSNTKKSIMEFIISVMYFFRQIGQYLSKKPSAKLGGNIDPFFALGFLEIVERIKKRNIKADIFIATIPIIIYAIIQILILEEVIVSKLIINVAKICICVLTMFFVKEHCGKSDIYKTAKITTVFMGIFTIISLILKNNNILWRFGDIINKYNTTRLQLFYLEPSELGFHVAILAIILLSYLFELKEKKQIKICIICILTNLIVLYFARSFGAIVILAATICIMLVWNLIKKFRKEKIIIYSILFVIGIVLIVWMYINDSPIIMRAIDTINGTDSSNRYRVGVSLDILKTSLKDYSYMGCGFGNLNSHQFRIQYIDKGIVQVLANSFIYFIIEGGIFAIVSLIILIIYLTKHAIKRYSLAKIGLLVFLTAYQIFGGHFTSGLTWGLYGLIASEWTEVDIRLKKEEK